MLLRHAVIHGRPRRRRAALAALTLLLALGPASAQTYSLAHLLQMPFEQLLSLSIRGAAR